MKKRFLLVLVLITLALAVLIVSCGGVPIENAGSSDKNETRISISVTRVIDEQAGIVCYLSNIENIFCLPLSETKLVR